MWKFIGGVFLGIVLIVSIGMISPKVRQGVLDELGLLPDIDPSSRIVPEVKSKPLMEFSFPTLGKTTFIADRVEIGEKLAEEKGYISRSFIYYWQNRKISGVLTMPDPEPSGVVPVIVMVRGFIPREQYVSGMGTRNGAITLARAGYVVVATDFLGFGNSDMPENDVWWERFSKPSQVLQLIASLSNIPHTDVNRIGIWGHSNGGQISLSVLEISGKSYPTVLWAPVSKPFPYSVLQFTDTDVDEGQAMRASIENLEWDYDVRQFSITQYFSSIKAPLQLHQGGQDFDVPASWSRDLVVNLKKNNVPIDYYYYPDSDHNLRPDWQIVMDRTVEFYKAKV